MKLFFSSVGVLCALLGAIPFSVASSANNNLVGLKNITLKINKSIDVLPLVQFLRFRNGKLEDQVIWDTSASPAYYWESNPNAEPAYSGDFCQLYFRSPSHQKRVISPGTALHVDQISAFCDDLGFSFVDSNDCHDSHAAYDLAVDGELTAYCRFDSTPEATFRDLVRAFGDQISVIRQ
jgi:hypothetical protein